MVNSRVVLTETPTLVKEVDIRHNVKIQYYPDGGEHMTLASRKVFIEPGYEPAEWNSDAPKVEKPKNMNNEVRSDSALRARKTVYDIARLNRFRWFITWTLDKKEIDRYDAKIISRKLQTFLRNRVNRNALQMHGLISGIMEMVDSGKKTKAGQVIYNMPQWKYGWSTAIELDENTARISNYITKYISKDFKKIFGSFYYAGGAGLMRAPPQMLYDMNYSDIEAKEYSKTGVTYKYVDLGKLTDEERADIEQNIIAYME